MLHIERTRSYTGAKSFDDVYDRTGGFISHGCTWARFDI
jgi:hypothetical protein